MEFTFLRLMCFVLTIWITRANLSKRLLLNDPNVQQDLHTMQISIQTLTAKVAALETKLEEETRKVKGQQAVITRLSTQTGIFPNRTACPDGFVKHMDSCYKFYDQKLTWPAALKFCESVGAHLIRTETDNEFSFLRNWIISIKSEMTTTGVWIGALQALVKGEWFWAEVMKPIPKIQWFPGQPGTGAEQDCIVLWKDHNFYYGDIGCSYAENLVCEIELDTTV